MSKLLVFTALATGLLAAPSMAQDPADPRRGGELYRNCVACHSLEPGAHLSGPTLAASSVGRRARLKASHATRRA